MKIIKTQLKQIIKEELGRVLEDYKPPIDPEFGEMWTADIHRGYQEGGSPAAFDGPSEPDNPEYMYGWNHPNNIEDRRRREVRRPNQ